MRTTFKGSEPVSVRARCPDCNDSYLKRHLCWASEPEGDLMQCSEVYNHIWVRDPKTRADERRNGERAKD